MFLRIISPFILGWLIKEIGGYIGIAFTFPIIIVIVGIYSALLTAVTVHSMRDDF